MGLLLIGLLAVVVTPGSGPAQVSSPVSVVADEPAAAFSTAEPPVLVPIGVNGLAITTMDAGVPTAIPTGTVQGRLPGGDAVDAHVLGADGTGIVVVSLPVAVSTYEIAPSPATAPNPDDTVAIHADEARVVSVAELADVRVADGTPITDAAGQLIGLCVLDLRSNRTTIVVIDGRRVAAIGARG